MTTASDRFPLLAPLLALFLGFAATSCGPQEDGSATTGEESQGGGFVIQNPQGVRPYFFDFGTVADGEIVTHVYKLKNTDAVPITVGDIIPSCSCTNPKISYVDEGGQLVKGKVRSKPVITVPPGAVADLQIQVNTKHVHRKNIDKLASVHLRCNSENNPFMAFELHLWVTKAFQATPESITMHNTPISTGARAHTDLITGIRGAKDAILGVHSVTEGMTASVEEVHTPAGMVWRVQAALEPPLELGTYLGKITLLTADDQGQPGGKPFHIDVRAEVVPDVVMFPPSFVFTRNPEDESLVSECAVTALAAGHRIQIADTLLQGDYPEDMKVTYEASAPDSDGKSKRWKVLLSLPPGADPPSFAGRLQVTLADPNLDVLSAPFAYRSETQ